MSAAALAREARAPPRPISRILARELRVRFRACTTPRPAA